MHSVIYLSAFVCFSKEESQRRPKSKLKKKKRSPTPSETVPVSENVCFICKKIGEVSSCQNKMCNKFYHLKCVNLHSWPDGEYFLFLIDFQSTGCPITFCTNFGDV